MDITVLQGTLSVFHKKFDICGKQKKIEVVLSTLAQFGVPADCIKRSAPVYCYNGNNLLDVKRKEPGKLGNSRLMMFFASSANLKIIANITHDTGVSCFEAENQIVKKH